MSQNLSQNLSRNQSLSQNYTTFPAVARAQEELFNLFGVGLEREAKGLLHTALTDPNDPDWLARTLFILSYTADSHTPGEKALQVWNSLSEDAMVKIHYRIMADGLRIIISGRVS